MLNGGLLLEFPELELEPELFGSPEDLLLLPPELLLPPLLLPALRFALAVPTTANTVRCLSTVLSILYISFDAFCIRVALHPFFVVISSNAVSFKMWSTTPAEPFLILSNNFFLSFISLGTPIGQCSEISTAGRVGPNFVNNKMRTKSNTK